MGNVDEQLERLRGEARQQIAAAADSAALDAIELSLLGRKQGKLTTILRGLGAAAPADRKVLGQRANEVKAEIEHLLAEKRRTFDRGRMANLAESEWIDVTAPGSRPPAGHTHPISEAIRDITAIFERIGFIRARHPEVDSDYYAFESLNMPPDHPARDEWETFFVREEGRGKREEGHRMVLTPHTSNGQVREMEKGILPIRMVNIGTCYRRQIDATHTPMFHQFEGLLVDRDVAVTHLKGTLDYFVQSYFGPDRRTRLRPFHFRFTEPSFEIDISCAVCGGSGQLKNGGRKNGEPGWTKERRAKERRTIDSDSKFSVLQSFSSPSDQRSPSFSSSVLRSDRCRTCKSGWLELGGAGMVHPNVLKAGGIDPSAHSGFAFGWGVERVLMMKAGIADIRLLYSNDLRSLQ